MSDTHIARLWMAFAAMGFYLALNGWLVSQGGRIVLDIGLVHEGRFSMSVLGLWFVPLMLVGLAGTGLCYARARRSRAWHERFPAMLAPGLDPARRSARVWQGLMLLLALGFPLLACLHFWNRLQKMPILNTTTPEAPFLGIWTKIPSRIAGDKLWRICDRREALDPGLCAVKGTSYVPWFETWILVGFHVLVGLVLAYYLVVLFRPRRG
jgi:hypothetical protein